MGSLMGGWDSAVQDPKVVTLERNKSFTKREIETYWRSKKHTEEEHLRAISGSPEQGSQESKYKESGRYQGSISLPVTYTRGNFPNVDSLTTPEKLKKDWWTRSNWAFLNERPVLTTDGPSYNYISQNHVTSFSS